MSEELKPCPFCGEKAIIIRGSDDYFRCGCEENCDLTSRDRDEAIDAWNTRPIEDALRVQLEEWKYRALKWQADLARKDEEIKALEEIIEAEATIQELRQERALAQMCLKPTFDENNALRRWSEKLETARARLAEAREGR